MSTEIDNLLWRAIEGAIGSEKTAWLREAPLHEIVGTRLGVDDFNLGDAVAHLGKTAREKKAFRQKTASALHALGELIGDAPAPPRPSFQRKIAAARKLRTLAQAHLSPQEHVKVASARQELDATLFDDMIKLATNPLMSVAKSDFARNMAKGLALGTGATVPLYVGGNMLAEDTAEEFRNKALQTAAGVGGIAALGYGANRLMDNAAYEARHPDKFKGAAFLEDPISEKVAELTATVYLDQFLAQVDQTEKVAELREVNRDYGVTVLCELEKSTASFSTGGGSARRLLKEAGGTGGQSTSQWTDPETGELVRRMALYEGSKNLDQEQPWFADSLPPELQRLIETSHDDSQTQHPRN